MVRKTVIVSKVEQDVIGLFNRDITQLLSINQIAKLLGKAYPHINSKVNNLIKLKVLNKMETGRSYLCSLNLKNSLTIAMLGLDEAEKKQKLEKKFPKIADDLETVQRKFNIRTIAYSKNKLIFVLDHIYDKEAIQKIAKSFKTVEQEYYTKDDFSEYVKYNDRLLKNKTVVYSCEGFYTIVDEILPDLMSKVMFNG